MNTLLSRVVTAAGIFRYVRDEQLKKVLAFNIVIELGILIDVRAVQVLNALSPKIWSPEGSTTDRSREPLNAYEPILVTPEGIEMDLRGQVSKTLLAIDKSPEGSVTDERDIQLLNRNSFNIVIEVGMVIEVRAVQPVNTLSAKIWSPVGRIIDGNREPINADEPILVTPEGIEIDVRGQLLKALAPIFKSAEERITDVKDVQPLKTKSFKIVIELGMLIDLRAAQSRNTLSPKIWSPDGILTDVSKLQPLNELASSEITPVADILMDLRRVEL